MEPQYRVETEPREKTMHEVLEESRPFYRRTLVTKLMRTCVMSHGLSIETGRRAVAVADAICDALARLEHQ